MRQRRLLLTARRLAVVTVATLALADPAAAHTELAEASPAPGSTVDASPNEVMLVFDDDVQPAVDPLVVSAVDGSRVAQGEAVLGPPNVLTVTLETLGPGTYVVAYRVLARDGHAVEGEYEFSVAAPPGVATAAGPDPAVTTPAAGDERAVDPAGDNPFGMRLVAIAALIGLVGAIAAWTVNRRETRGLRADGPSGRSDSPSAS